MWFVCDICPQPNTDCLTILLSQNNLSKSSLQDNSRPKSAKLDVSNELQRTIWRIFTPIKVTHNNHSRLEQMKVNRGVNSLRIHIFNLNGFAWRCAWTFKYTLYYSLKIFRVSARKKLTYLLILNKRRETGKCFEWNLRGRKVVKNLELF